MSVANVCRGPKNYSYATELGKGDTPSPFPIPSTLSVSRPLAPPTPRLRRLGFDARHVPPKTLLAPCLIDSGADAAQAASSLPQTYVPLLCTDHGTAPEYISELSKTVVSMSLMVVSAPAFPHPTMYCCMRHARCVYEEQSEDGECHRSVC